MKPPQFIITLILSSICLVLSLLILLLGKSGTSMQTTVQQRQIEIQAEVQKKQEDINKGGQSQQIGTKLLQDIAAAAIDSSNGKVKNEKLNTLLKNNGITVTVNQNPNSQPTPAR